MSSWIGTAGALMPLVCASHLARENGMPSQDVQRFQSGKAQVRVGPMQPREWKIARGVTRPSDRLTLEYLTAGGSSGPVAYYSDEAVTGNVLQPEHSLLLDWQRPGSMAPGWTRAGSITAQDGTFIPVMGVASTSSVVVGAGYPVPPGQVFALAAYAGGSGVSVEARFRNAAGTALTTSVSNVSSGAGQRVWASALIPATTATVDVAVSGASAASVGLITLTFTSSLMPAQIGTGCRSAIVTQRSVDVLTAWSEPSSSASLSSVQYSIEEVRQ